MSILINYERDFSKDSNEITHKNKKIRAEQEEFIDDYFESEEFKDEEVNSMKNTTDLIIPFKYTFDHLNEKSILFESDYTFLKTYFQFHKGSIPEIIKFNINVLVRT